jgi:hypothetical protein
MMKVVFILCAVVVIALLFFILVITLIHNAASKKKYMELKAMLEAIFNKPMVAPVVTVQAPFRQKAPVSQPAVAPAQTPAPVLPVSAAAPQAVSPAPAVRPPVRKVPAKYSAGEVKLHSVPDKIAAMLMAITADELKLPVSELRFISIREVQ